jgi:signal transduction histidine kinase
MEERLKLVNGTLSIEAQPQRGTTIHVIHRFNAARSANQRR